jgi:hypothetical protein
MIRVLAKMARDERLPSYERLTAVAMLTWIDSGKAIRPVLISNLLKKENEQNVAPVFAPIKTGIDSAGSPEEKRQAALALVRQKGE